MPIDGGDKGDEVRRQLVGTRANQVYLLTVVEGAEGRPLLE